MTDFKNLSVDRKAKSEEAQADNCGCGSSADSCCSDYNQGGAMENDQESEFVQKTVIIDGKSIETIPGDKNIVDVARRSKIGIPAPCYLSNRKHGCCNACVVEIDGGQKYACTTTPRDGMNITINREDLKALRKERLFAYNEAIRTGKQIPCSC